MQAVELHPPTAQSHNLNLLGWRVRCTGLPPGM